jgi:hypothetical protein
VNATLLEGENREQASCEVGLARVARSRCVGGSSRADWDRRASRFLDVWAWVLAASHPVASAIRNARAELVVSLSAGRAGPRVHDGCQFVCEFV